MQGVALYIDVKSTVEIAFMIFCILVALAVLYMLYYAVALYFIDPYIRLKKLSVREEGFISYHLPFYRKLSLAQRNKFKKRIIRFRSRKEIVFNGEVEDKGEIILLISATAVMLTLGHRDYLLDSVKRIIVYPSRYYSIFTRKDHYGEYNAGLKTLVFAADQLREGFKLPNDNINLGAHEFAHALIFNMKGKSFFQGFDFKKGLKKMKKISGDSQFIQKVKDTKYFRAYGQTNLHEFFAVAVENYVETPAVFKKEFPALYSTMKKMLNFDFNKPYSKLETHSKT
ncbi:zinc-dependent peptidase [Spongiimicrobium salis]|uniref:zinc-dependent peptidase n=1 Tax=Spongiimicrobium salis TaxID=1667022 RepID=UPI00374CFE66